MRIAYVNYGYQSGVTPNVVRAISALGHEIVPVDPTAVLSLRFPGVKLPRPTPRVLLSIAVSAMRFGPQAMNHRWNTVFAFDQHSKEAGDLLSRLSPRPDVVLQNGALFAPGRPPPFPYVLLLDNTCVLAQRHPPIPEAGIGRHIEFGAAWLRRERACYQGAAFIAAFSEVVKRSLVSDYGVDPARVAVTGAGANVVPTDGRREDDGHTLVFVGKSKFRGKGGLVLLHAFEMLRMQHPEARLLLVGPTDAPAQLPEGVTNLGLLPFIEVERLLRQATLFVLPTLREPFGIAYLDAMLCGAPCVGSDVDAVPEILGDAGVIVPHGDPEALARVLRELLEDPVRRAALSEAGRKRVLERGYLWPEVGKRLANLLTQAARTRRAA